MIYKNQQTFPAKATAQQAFGQAVYRLFHVDAWSGLSTLVAGFSQRNTAGQRRPDGSPVVGEHILIRRPGPSSANGVQVIDRGTNERRVAFPILPSSDACQGSSRQGGLRQGDAQFQVVRDGRTLIAAETGRKETITQTEPRADDYAVANRLTAETGWLSDQQMP